MPILTNVGDFALFKPSTPYLYVQQIRDFSVELSGTQAAQEFRWSIDNLTYSSWIELSMDNLRAVVLDPNKELWVEFRATLVSDGPVDVDNYQISFELSANDKYAGYVPPSLDCSESGNVTSITRIQDLCFNPYDVNPAICLYNELNYMVNSMFGHNVEYFRSVPDKAAQDIVLKEYTLSYVEESKCLKVMVENNEFPSSQIAFNPFGMNYEQPFEIQIDKAYWIEIFGNSASPQKGDIIYFPINGRIYEVLSSYMHKAFMEQDSYWKVSLIMYNPKSNRYEPQSVRNLLDDLTTDTSELFETELREQEEKHTKPQQYSRFIGDREYDPSRESIHENIQVIERQIVNYSTVISEFQYRLNNLVSFNSTTQPTAVQYREPVNFTSTVERAYSAWFSEIKPAFFNPADLITIMALDTNINQLTLEISSNRAYAVGDYLKISRAGGLTFYGKIINVIAQDKYTIQLNSDVVAYLDEYNQSWSGLSNYKVEKTVPNNLLNGYDIATQKGVRIDMFVGRYITILLNANEYVYPLDADLIPGNWYGIFINMSNQFRQASVNVWERKWVDGVVSSPQTTELFNIYNKTINSIVPEDRVNSLKYKLDASNLELTNIRLFDQTAEIEKQTLILNQNIVQDAQRAIIIDNALGRLSLPFIAQSK